VRQKHDLANNLTTLFGFSVDDSSTLSWSDEGVLTTPKLWRSQGLALMLSERSRGVMLWRYFSHYKAPVMELREVYVVELVLVDFSLRVDVVGGGSEVVVGEDGGGGWQSSSGVKSWWGLVCWRKLFI